MKGVKQAMTEEEELDPRRITFSQAQGYEPIPGPLALGELSLEARVKIWNILVEIPSGPFSSAVDFAGQVDRRWRSILQTIHCDFLLRPLDEFPAGRESTSRFVKTYKPAILENLGLNKIFDLLQLIMRHPDCPDYFIEDVAATFKECRLAYFVDMEQPVTILPAVTTQEGESLIESIKELREVGLQGAETHLKKAGELVNSGDWAGAVRESINAVESVARQLAPNASTLGPALDALEKGGRLHPALKEAFSRLYGYTSDEEGIRHPLIENATSPVGRDEALFMLGACASFSSYRWRRHQAGS